jgi:prefoldin subunit 5
MSKKGDGKKKEGMDITQLSIEQLQQLQQQFEQEFTQFQRSFQMLAGTVAKFHRSGEAVEDLAKDSEGAPQ